MSLIVVNCVRDLREDVLKTLVDQLPLIVAEGLAVEGVDHREEARTSSVSVILHQEDRSRRFDVSGVDLLITVCANDVPERRVNLQGRVSVIWFRVNQYISDHNFELKRRCGVRVHLEPMAEFFPKD